MRTIVCRLMSRVRGPATRVRASCVLAAISALALAPRCSAVQVGVWEEVTPPLPPGEVSSPQGIAVGSGGRLYVGDGGNRRLLMRDAEGQWSVAAPSGMASNQVSQVADVAEDPQGNLYVADRAGVTARLLRRDPAGRWRVIDTEGAQGLCCDAAGNLYAASGNRIRRRSPEGEWTVLAEEGQQPGQVYSPTDVAADGSGNLYVAEGSGGRVQRRDSRGQWTVPVDRDSYPDFVHSVSGVAVTPQGDLFVTDWDAANRQSWLLRIGPDGTRQVVASQGKDLGFLSFPGKLASDGDGNLYVVDVASNRVVRRAPDGRWSELTQVASQQPGRRYGTMVADARGNLNVIGLGWIDRRDSQGKWSTVGTWAIPCPQGTRLSAVTMGADGSLYAATLGTQVGVWKRDPQGEWSLLAGEGTQADQVTRPSELAVDSWGTLYVLDRSADGRVLQRPASGQWSLVASVGWGLGMIGAPSRITVGPDGSLYVQDGLVCDNPCRVQKRDPFGQWAEVAWGDCSFAVGPPGVLYTADGYYGAEVWSCRGPRRERIAVQGTGLGQFMAAPTLASSPSGDLYALEAAPLRIQRYRVVETVPGDLDGDGTLTLKDARLLMGWLSQPEGSPPAAGDLNGDDAVDLQDVILLLKTLLGLAVG